MDVLNAMLGNYPGKDFIVQGFQFGFDLGFKGEDKNVSCRNNLSVRENPDVTREKIFSEIEKGRIAGPFPDPPFENFRCSPLALREKTTPGQYRLLHNLSSPYNDFGSVNANIPDDLKKVTYDNIDTALQILANRPFSFMAKSDIAEAFRLIPLHPLSYKWTGFLFENQYFYDKCLPMGASSSCQIFESFSDALKFILLEQYGVSNVVKVLDDFLFIADTENDCREALDSFRSLCSLSGVPLSEPKTVDPTRKLVFLGYLIDLDCGTISIPLEKIHQYTEHSRRLMNQKHAKLREIRSIIGKLGFVTNIIPGGRCFLRRMHDLTKGQNDNNALIKITKNAILDLKVWVSFMETYNGKAILTPRVSLTNEDLRFFSDSSKVGFGACFRNKYIQGKFPKKWEIPRRNIQFLELYPIYIMVEIFASQLSNKAIVFVTDNHALVGSLNKMSSKSKQVMKLLRPMVLVLMRNNILFSAEHIEGKLNVFCDKLSRFQMPQELQSHPADWERVPVPRHLRPSNLKA